MSLKRLLVKLSGEVLKGSLPAGIDWEVVDGIARRIAATIKDTGVELGFVIGGGNIFRGAGHDIAGYNRLLGDNMGMMATVINGLAFVERLRAHGVDALLLSGVKIEGVVDIFTADAAEAHFKKGGAVVFCGGIGNPYFSTDTTAALRALQIGADYLVKATKVDGIYDRDPMRYSDAVRYETISYKEIIDQRLEIMDLTAMQLLAKNRMKLLVFCMTEEGALEKVCRGEHIGTIVKE